MNVPLPSEIEQRERAVTGFLALTEDFGSVVERFFNRLYRGIERKQGLAHQSTANDQQAVLKLRAEVAERKQKQAEEFANLIQQVCDNLSEGVIAQDVSGSIILMNEAALQLLGSKKAFWDSELARLAEKSREVYGQEATGAELEPVGEPVRLHVNHRVIAARIALTRNPSGSVIVLRDATKDALADRLKDDFITQITHELRTPLTAIKGMSEVLLGMPDDRPPNRKFLDAIGRNAAILDRMIIELLDISEMNAGTFAVRQEPLDLKNMLLNVIEGQEPRLKKANLNIGLMISSPTIAFNGDDRRLRWAVGHLLDNAINYTPAGGSIQIRLKQRGQNVRIQVKDSGVGILERDLPNIFNRFVRGEARTKAGKVIDPRGLGQGLYIARAVAQAHGGSLTVSSTVGQGSLFTLELPIRNN